MRREIAGAGHEGQGGVRRLVDQFGVVDAGFHGLDGVEIAVLAQQAAADCFQQVRYRGTARSVVHDKFGGFVDPLLAVQEVR